MLVAEPTWRNHKSKQFAPPRSVLLFAELQPINTSGVVQLVATVFLVVCRVIDGYGIQTGYWRAGRRGVWR